MGMAVKSKATSLSIITQGGVDQKVLCRQASDWFSMKAQESTQDSPKDEWATNKK
jgi:hypothetical protein